MTQERHPRIRELFDQAVALPESERIAFLETACAGDAMLFPEIVRLLDAHTGAAAQSFLEGHAADGRRIDRYLIQRELGRGAMGIVYQALDPVFSRSVAIKVIRPQWLAEPAEAQILRERLFREARAAGVLSHPGIVTVYDAGQQDDLAFIVMECVEGQSLAQTLASEARLDRAQAIGVLGQVAAALDHAHRNGIVHRDVKPANIVLQPDGAAKLTDFGVAKVLSAHTATVMNLAAGTPSYMSPEQLEAQEVDGRSDQFSLAAVAYEMLAGSRPFQAESLAALAHKIVNGSRPSAHAANPELPAAVDRVFERAFARRPQQRYATCTEFVAALESALTRVSPWSSRRAAAVSLPALALLLLAWASTRSCGTLRYAALVAPQSNSRAAVDPSWERLPVPGDSAGPVWYDIAWFDQEGWLAGEVIADGALDARGVRQVGEGILLHSTDQGASWHRIENDRFSSGHGEFPWGPHGDFRWRWDNVGPIGTIHVLRRPPRMSPEVWIAATSGIYRSLDGGQTWQRTTPRPDNKDRDEIFAHFSRMCFMGDPEQVFASGWQGIAHWSAAKDSWTLQYPAYTFPMMSVFAIMYNGGEVWAVGQDGSSKTYLVRHLQPPDRWQTIDTGIALAPNTTSLTDVVVIDQDTIFAISGNGVVIKGSKAVNGSWSWSRVPVPTTTYLSSIVWAERTLWISGYEGTLLTSEDLGQTWKVTRLTRVNGEWPDLKRLRVTPYTIWAVGFGAVYRKHLRTTH